MRFFERLFCGWVWLAWLGLMVQGRGRKARGTSFDGQQQRRGLPIPDPGPNQPAWMVTAHGRIEGRRHGMKTFYAAALASLVLAGSAAAAADSSSAGLLCWTLRSARLGRAAGPGNPPREHRLSPHRHAGVLDRRGRGACHGQPH